MAQLLVTHATERHWYNPIANIKRYSEPEFERKLFKYGSDIFENYHVLKFKFELKSDDLPGKSFEPDLLLISKSLKKWIIIEVEICKNPSSHTKNQIICFSNPKFSVDALVSYVLNQKMELAPNEAQIYELFSNESPELLIVLDDYRDDVFKKFYELRKDLRICVLEVYKRQDLYDFETYRFGGDYPYELTSFTKLEIQDDQHFRLLKADIVPDLPPPGTEFELLFNMHPLKGVMIDAGRSGYWLKIPDHNFPRDIYLLLGIDIHGTKILKRI